MAIFVNVLGTIGRDAELKASKEGKQFVTFSLATNSGFGENKQTQWLDCLYFNTNIAPYLAKGKQVFIQGELTSGAYTNKEGKPACNLRVSVRNIEFTHQEKSEHSSQESKGGNFTPDDFNEEKIPF